MYLKFIIICLCINQVFSAVILNTFLHFKELSNKKCPSLMNSSLLKSEPEFFKVCDTVDKKLYSMESVSSINENAVLCSLYFSMFEHLCVAVGEINYDPAAVSEALKNVMTMNITDVCASLGNIVNVSEIQGFILTALNSSSTCHRLCSGYDMSSNIKFCALANAMWKISKVFNKEPQETKPITTDKQQKVDVSASEIHDLQKNVTHADIATSQTGLGPTADNNNQSLSRPNNSIVAYGSNLPVDTQKNSEDKQQSVQPNDTMNNTQALPKTSDVEDTVFKSSTTQAKASNNSSQISMQPQLTNASTTKSEANAAHLGVPSEKEIVSSHKKNPSDDSHNTVDSNKENVSENTKKNEKLEKPEKQSDPLIPNGDEKQTEMKNEGKKGSAGGLPAGDYTYFEEGGDGEFAEPPVKQEEIVKTNEEKVNLEEDHPHEKKETPKSSEVKSKPVEVSKPKEIDEDDSNVAVNSQNQNIDDSDSYFFSYFMMVCVMFICGYVAYHNKQKILALVLEGRKGRRPSRSRRPNSANYRKLDTTLEEAVTSSCNKNTTQVIY